MAYFLGQDPSGSVNISGALFTPDSVFAVLKAGTVSVYKNDGSILIDGALPADIDYVLTDSPFASYSALETFINGHFFRVLNDYPNIEIAARPLLYLRDNIGEAVHVVSVSGGALLFDGLPVSSSSSGATAYWVAKEDSTPPTEAEFLAGHTVTFVPGADVSFDLRYIFTDLFIFLAEPITEPEKLYKSAGPTDIEALGLGGQFASRQNLTSLSYYASNYATSNTTNVITLKQTL